MKTAAVLALLASAGAASAIDLRADPIDSLPGYAGRDTVVYTDIPGPYSAFPAAAGSLGFDDYDSTIGGVADTLTSMRFVGGVSTVGGVIDFNFYSTSAVLVTSFSLAFPQAGNFIWTITNVNASIPGDGILQLSAHSDTTGRWFLTAGLPTVGSTSQTYGGGTSGATHLNHCFELSVPTPGSLALLGMGGLVARRRRR